MLLLQESLRGRFVAQIAGVLGGAKQVELVKRAIECLLEKEGSELIGALYQGLLVINLYNASSSISNARSVTSSYRMTNKPCESAHLGYELCVMCIAQFDVLFPLRVAIEIIREEVLILLVEPFEGI